MTMVPCSLDQQKRYEEKLKILFDGKETDTLERYFAEYRDDSRWLINKAVQVGISREEENEMPGLKSIIATKVGEDL